MLEIKTTWTGPWGRSTKRDDRGLARAKRSWGAALYLSRPRPETAKAGWRTTLYLKTGDWREWTVGDWSAPKSFKSWHPTLVCAVYSSPSPLVLPLLTSWLVLSFLERACLGFGTVEVQTNSQIAIMANNHEDTVAEYVSMEGLKILSSSSSSPISHRLALYLHIFP